MENNNLSPDRKLKTYLSLGIILTVFAITVYTIIKDKVITSLITICCVTSVFLIIFILCDGMLRLCYILISLMDMNQQSKETFWTMVKYYFAPSAITIIITVISILTLTTLVITIRKCPLYYIWDFGPYVCIPIMIFSFLLLRVTNLTEWELNFSFPISAMKGLDYGTGMAYSFYYGYLRLILPSTGTATKGIVEKIENFEDKHNVTFPVHKLFILIPLSGYVPPNLKEASYQWMESAHELEEEQRNRAGNIGRRYQNNAYKIYPDGQDSGNNPEFVVVEGATPLLTYYEVQKHNHAESNVYKQYKNMIILMFYKKLQEILQNESDTRDLCELIYYDDYDSNGVKVNVGKIILERIYKIKNST